MKTLYSFLLTTLFFVAFSAFAEDMPRTFDELDGDGNGYLNQEEASKRSDLASKWNDADKNSDGKIDISEFSAFEVRMVPPDDMAEPEPGAAPTK